MNTPLKSTKNAQAGCLLIFGAVWTIGSAAMTIDVFSSSPLGALLPAAFVLLGLCMIWAGLKPMIAVRKIGAAQIILSVEAPRVGEKFLVNYQQTAQSPVSVLNHTMTLIFRESATYTRGSNTTTVTHPTTVNTISYGPLALRPGETNQRQWSIQIPADGMHSFEGRRNKLNWVIQTKVTMAGWPTYEEEFPFTVTPDRLGG
ncbi:hypothetical protein CCAX7_33210 [Capsulimonas corticalis]|uniref:Uncharacterized protein n=1 Tax=Capsulimonas corticalis TaxID=2219043 RepID=A0A402CYQ1_9BACT|nr:hypothetical protein [Capsulimonas corticalis]BDI31270.1 hypothetical protein CCAX7_33210 [Capsulimonas corticalis]